jgi:hypothetical protein
MNINVETGWKIWVCEPETSVSDYTPPCCKPLFNLLGVIE